MLPRLPGFLKRVPGHLGIVHVRGRVTGGLGTSASPWTGWDTAITWSSNTLYYFANREDGSPGYYRGNINLRDKPYCTLVGQPGATIRCANGTTTIIDQYSSNHCPGLIVRDLILDGGGQDNVSAFFLRGAHRARIENVTVQNLGSATHGIYAEFCILASVTRYKQSNWPPASLGNIGITAGLPAGTQGIRLLSGTLPSATVDPTGPCTQWTITAPVIEGCSDAGLNFESVWYSQVLGGTSEANGKGLVLQSGARDNAIINLDCEGNTVLDWDVGGRDNALRSCAGTNGTLAVSGTNNLIDGGWWGSITTAGATHAILRDLHYGENGGTLTDTGTDTQIAGCTDNSGNVVSPKPAPAPLWSWAADGTNLSVVAGNAVLNASDATQAYDGQVWFQGTANNGDSRRTPIFDAPVAGWYEFELLGWSKNDVGKVDLSIDGGAAFQTGIDFYSASTASNFSVRSNPVRVTAGTHYLKVTVNGKNASSAGYFLVLSRVFVRRVS